MGILTIPCPGRLADGSSCPHRFWRVVPLPKACPKCLTPTSPGDCGKCGRPLEFGAKFCVGCSTPAPPTSFTDVVWAIPDGIVARRIDITLKRGDNRRFLIPAGVSALTLIDGRPRVVQGSSIDYWTVLRATGAASEIEAEALRAQAERRARSPEPVLNIVLVRPGPYPLMLEFSGLRCSDGVEVEAQVRAELAIGSVQRILGRYLSGTDSVVSLDRIERDVAAELQSAVSAGIARLGVRDLLDPGVCTRLLEAIRDPFTRTVSGMGLEASSISVIRIEAPAAAEVLKARGAAALEGAEVATLRMRVESDVARQEVLLEHTTAIESIEQKRKFVIQQAATREADTELHGMDQRERVAQRVRAVEKALCIEQVITEAELRDLESSRADDSRLQQTIRAIGLRVHVRKNELEEIDGQIEQDRRRREHERTEKIADAQADAAVSEIETGVQTHRGMEGLKVHAQHVAVHGAKEDADSKRAEMAKSAEHSRQMEAERNRQDHEARMLQLKGTMTEGQLAIIERISPELASALRPKAGSDDSPAASLETMRQVSQAQLSALREEIERSGQAHRETLRAIVEVVEKARSGGGPTTTVNTGGRDSPRR